MRKSRIHLYLAASIPCLWLAVAGHCLGGQERPSGWARAISPRAWAFPRDYGSHPEYRTEWWYFTGNLRDDEGSRYGYQLTFFRQGVRPAPALPSNPWSVRDLYLAHFTITDVAARTFRVAERISRAGPELAGAGLRGMDVWLLDWFARMEGSRILLKARHEAMQLQLELAPGKPPVLHGHGGLSRKGETEGQASYYSSLTRLDTRGLLSAAPEDSPTSVTGISWFDHEFGSALLGSNQAGWDWFGLHLSDGRDLMIYLLRLKDGSTDPASSGTLVEADGAWRFLSLSQVQVSALQRWISPRSKGSYPSRWKIRIQSAGIDLVIEPLLADQELVTQGSSGVVYWEGAVAGQGVSSGQAVSCEGYMELTGYAGSLGGLF